MTNTVNAIKLLCGNSHDELVQLIGDRLNVKASPMLSLRLSSGEISLTVCESVRDQDVFIIQTASSNLSDGIMELCQLISASKAASARRIVTIIPCYPYARQDKKEKGRAPITAKLIANLLTVAGANHIITMDLHASQIQGFFDVPVDNLLAEPLFVNYLQIRMLHMNKDVILVSPDAGGVKRCASLADKLKMDFAIIHKERQQANQVSRMVLVGHVSGKIAILVDDMADTCRTLILASETLINNGAKEIYALVVHPILSGDSIERIEKSSIKKLVVTNTIPLSETARKCNKIEVLDISGTLAEAIRRIHNGESVSYLFSHAPGE